MGRTTQKGICVIILQMIRFLSFLPLTIILADYVPIRVNYSKENKKSEAMERLGFPDRFGFPVLVILDGRGDRLHIQDTWYLEQEDGYSEEKIKRFLLNWNMKAVSRGTDTGNE